MARDSIVSSRFTRFSLSFLFLRFFRNGRPTSIELLSFSFRRCRDARAASVRLAKVAEAAAASQEEEEQQQQLSERLATTTLSPMLAAKA